MRDVTRTHHPTDWRGVIPAQPAPGGDVNGRHVLPRAGTHPGRISLDCTVRSREASQHAMVGWVLLARMELAQPAGLAGSGTGLQCRIFCLHHLTSVVGIDRRRRIDLHYLKTLYIFCYMATIDEVNGW